MVSFYGLAFFVNLNIFIPYKKEEEGCCGI
jgi:hypothetical protein